MSSPALVPSVRIRSQSAGQAFDLREIWRSRELLRSFCSREMAVRYKQTLLGPLWLVLQPFLHAAVFAIFMHGLARVPSAGMPYALFAYAGLLPWLFFANGVQSLSYGLMMNAHLVTRVYFPRVLIPISMVIVRIVDFAAAIAAFLLLSWIMGFGPSWRLVVLPLLIVQTSLLTLSLGAWFSCFTSRYRDFGTLLPVILQFGMFASPVIYPSALVPEPWRAVYFLNPMAALIEGFRAALLGTPYSVTDSLVSLAVTLLLTVVLIRAFGRLEAAAVEAM